MTWVLKATPSAVAMAHRSILRHPIISNIKQPADAALEPRRVSQTALPSPEYLPLTTCLGIGIIGRAIGNSSVRLMKVAMIGTGYVDLVSGACFADFGHVVTCIDKDAGKIDRLHQNIMPIDEPGLDDLVEKNVKEEHLFFATDAQDAIADADAVFIAVGTPSRRGDGHADLSFMSIQQRKRSPSLWMASPWS